MTDTTAPDTTAPENTAPATLAMVSVDCADPAAEAPFWSAMLGLQIVAAGEDYAMLAGAGPALGFGRVPDFEPPPWPNPHGSKQFHLDLAVTDLDAAQARAIDLGALLADPQPGRTWRVLLDPAGHPFCLTDAATWG